MIHSRTAFSRAAAVLSAAMYAAMAGAVPLLAIALMTPADLATPRWLFLARKYAVFGIFAASLSAYALYCLRGTCRTLSGKRRSGDSGEPKSRRAAGDPPRRRLQLAGQLLLSLLILTQVITNIRHEPLELNEFANLANIRDGRYASIGEILSNGPIPSMNLSRWSMEAFGWNRAAARLPSILFTGIFLTALNLLCLRFFPLWAAWLLFLHELVNPSAAWYLQSMRAYSAGQAVTLWTILLLVAGTTNGFRGYRGWLTPIFLVLPVFFNTLASIPLVAFSFALIVWTHANRHRLSEIELKAALRTVVLTLGFLPIVLWIPYRIASAGFTDFSGNPYGSDFGFFGTLGSMLGFSAAFPLWPAAIVLWLILLVWWILRARPASDFFGIAVATGFTLYAGLHFIFHFNFEDRFLLDWLAPLTLVSAMAAQSLPGRWRWAAQGLVVAVFVLAPLYPRRVPSDFVLQFPGYEEFMAAVRGKLPSQPGTCLSLSGNQQYFVYKKWFTGSLYFADEVRRFQSSADKCERHYHISYGTLTDAEILAAIDQRGVLEVIYTDGRQSTLYRVAKRGQGEERASLRSGTQSASPRSAVGGRLESLDRGQNRGESGLVERVVER